MSVAESDSPAQFKIRHLLVITAWCGVIFMLLRPWLHTGDLSWALSEFWNGFIQCFRWYAWLFNTDFGVDIPTHGTASGWAMLGMFLGFFAFVFTVLLLFAAAMSVTYGAWTGDWANETAPWADACKRDQESQ